MGSDRVVVSHALGRISEPVQSRVVVEPQDNMQPSARIASRPGVPGLFAPVPGSHDSSDRRPGAEDGDRDHHDHHHQHHHHP